MLFIAVRFYTVIAKTELASTRLLSEIQARFLWASDHGIFISWSTQSFVSSVLLFKDTLFNEEWCWIIKSEPAASNAVTHAWTCLCNTHVFSPGHITGCSYLGTLGCTSALYWGRHLNSEVTNKKHNSANNWHQRDCITDLFTLKLEGRALPCSTSAGNTQVVWLAFCHFVHVSGWLPEHCEHWFWESSKLLFLKNFLIEKNLSICN